MKIRVIVNPSAAAGAARKKIPHLRRLFDEHRIDAQVVITTQPGEATHLARRAERDGIDVLGVMGGDGTFNEVAQASLTAAGNAAFGPTLALIPAGTGGDLKRSLGLTNDLEAAVKRIVDGERRPLDVGVVTPTRPASGSRRVFLNVASVGLSAMVCDLANQGPKWVGGKITFYTAALFATFMYRNLVVRVVVDGLPVYEGRAYLVAVANGQFFGGGMHIAPRANISDGLFDVVILGDYSKLGAVGLSSAIYDGTHIDRSKTVTTRGGAVEVHVLGLNPDKPRRVMELDGEVPPLQVPVRFEVGGTITVCT